MSTPVTHTDPCEDDPIVRIDFTLSTIRRMVSRRVIGRAVVDQVGMQLSHLDVIEAVRRAEEEEGEATVGAVAQRLGLDPSRGSRMVAQLVEAGLLRRDVSQADGRRAVLRLTDQSLDLVQQIRLAKRRLIREAMTDWSEADVSRFSVMIEKFVTAFSARAEQRVAERKTLPADAVPETL